jgi:hypothetical protein
VWPSASGNCRRPRRSSIVDSYPNDVLESPPTVGHYRQLSRLPRFTSSSSRVPEDAETIMVELSRYSLDLVREDAEFILYRAHSKQLEPPSILLLTPSSTRPSPETLEKINHEYSLSSELDNMWALPPLAISSYNDRRVLVLEDPGGAPLSGITTDRVSSPRRLLTASSCIRISSAKAGKLCHRRKV